MFIGVNLAVAKGQLETLDTMVVTAPLHRQSSQTALPVTILSGEELRLKAGNTVGATLDQEPGITNSSFGPGVGRPVIRGQSGPRVRILQGGTGTLDVSSLSPDHAISSEAILAERIEVLKGPSTLLYGNGAIGGVVNVIDNRIPMSLPDSIKLALEQRFQTVSDEKTSVAKLEGAVGRVALHFDGFYRDRNDVAIDGFAVDRETRANGVFNTKGFIANSDARAKSGTGGFSYVGDHGYSGIAVNRMENDYGIPATSEDETVRIDLTQTRYDWRGEYRAPVLFLDSLRGFLTYNDYEHTEIENGESGTHFENESFEIRTELDHKPIIQNNHGVLGFQIISTDFSAVGEESFVPVTEKSSVGFFGVEDFHAGDWTFEAGLRIEHIKLNPKALQEKNSTPISASVSALWDFDVNTTLSLAFSRSERAPEIEELFSHGAHLATQSFELGDSGLKKEAAHTIEIGIDTDLGWLSAEINAYANWVDNYIFLDTRGEVFNLDSEIFETVCSGAECLPVRQYTQRDAIFKGFEAEIQVPLLGSSLGDLDMTLFADYVRGKLDGAGDIPRLPPLRYGFQLAYGAPNWQARLRLTRADKQSHPGNNENETDGYLLLGAGFDYHLDFMKDSKMLAFVKANNLLDEEIRNSTSFLREFSPEPGRAFELGLRMTF